MQGFDFGRAPWTMTMTRAYKAYEALLLHLLHAHFHGREQGTWSTKADGKSVIKTYFYGQIQYALLFLLFISFPKLMVMCLIIYSFPSSLSLKWDMVMAKLSVTLCHVHPQIPTNGSGPPKLQFEVSVCSLFRRSQFTVVFSHFNGKGTLVKNRIWHQNWQE